MFNIVGKFKKGFTLSEVLITLGVIGVVAAITMPVLVSKIQDLVFTNQKKKAVSEFSQAFEQAKLNDEFVDNSTSNNFNAIQNKFKLVKTCTNAREEGCWIDTCDLSKAINTDNTAESGCYAIATTMGEDGSLNYSQGHQADSLGFVDNAGRQWVHYKRSNAIIFIVDVNGDKKPNKLGKDRFTIWTYNEEKDYTKAPRFFDFNYLGY